MRGKIITGRKNVGITSFALNRAVKKPDIESFSRYLFIGPHPDDIEIGAGATIAKLAAMGKEICFIICCDGRYGTENCPNTSPAELVTIRKAEAWKAAGMLGVRDVRFLSLCDGGNYDVKELKLGMAEAIGDFKPDIIFAPDPVVANECHEDHLNVGETARRLAYFAPYKYIMANYMAESAPVQAIAYYMTAKPNVFVKVSKEDFIKQLESIFSCHESQFPAGSGGAKSLKLYLNLRAADFGVRCLSPRAEGFRTLSRTRMHCLPEE